MLLAFEGMVIMTAAGRGPVPDPERPPAMALFSAAAPAKAPVAAVRRQPFLAPLAAEAAADPGHGPLFTPDLAEVAPLAIAIAPPPAPAPAAPVALVPAEVRLPPAELPVVPELSPAGPEPEGIDLPGPITVYLNLLCPGISIGSLRLGGSCSNR